MTADFRLIWGSDQCTLKWEVSVNLNISLLDLVADNVGRTNEKQGEPSKAGRKGDKPSVASGRCHFPIRLGRAVGKHPWFCPRSQLPLPSQDPSRSRSSSHPALPPSGEAGRRMRMHECSLWVSRLCRACGRCRSLLATSQRLTVRCAGCERKQVRCNAPGRVRYLVPRPAR